MNRVRDIEWERALLEPIPNRDAENRFRRETGRPPGLIRFFEGSPWLSDAVVRFSVGINTHVRLESDLFDLIGLVVSQDNSCRFCFGAQRVFMRALGISEDRISRLEQEVRTADLTERELAALAYAKRLSRSQPLATPRDLDSLRRAGFDEDEIIELTGQIGLHLFFNRLSTFVALPPHTMERLPDAWWMRLLQPVVRPYFLRMRKRPEPTPLSGAQRTGPFSAQVNALDGLPMAIDWREAIDSAFESEALSPYAAGIAYSVIARALGCQVSEAEGRAILIDRGMPEPRVTALLDTLSGEGVDEIDHLVATFARESVWYVPARVQRRCQGLREKLSREQLLDLIGITAIANSICRLGVITAHPC